jgi:ferric-dicitrate binding protein FerR (iron transport regulator)
MTGHDPANDLLAELLQRSGPRPAPSMAAADAARAEARRAWQAGVQIDRSRKKTRRIISGLATAALLAAAVWRYETLRIANPAIAARLDGSTRVLRIDEQFRTEAAERVRMTLLSGVEVRLDGDTEIHFAGPSAIALERGALFVDTGATRSAASSVEIRTAAGTARDIGTQFEVRILAGVTRVRVREGVVQLIHGEKTHTASRGVELVADGTSVTQREAPAAGADWKWVSLAAAPYDTDGKSLSQFLEWVGREGGWEIQFSDEQLRRATSSIVLHGSIAGQSPDQALETILPTCGLTHRIEGDRVTIQSASPIGQR